MKTIVFWWNYRPTHSHYLTLSLSLHPKRRRKTVGGKDNLSGNVSNTHFFPLFLQAVLCFELQVLFSAEWPLAAKDLIDSHPKQWSNHKICLPSDISKKKKSSPNTSCTSGKMLWWFIFLTCSQFSFVHLMHGNLIHLILSWPVQFFEKLI